MQLSSSKPCVVILTEKEVEVSVNNHATFTLPKNYLAAFALNVIYRPAPIAKAPPQQAALFMNCLSPAKAKPLQRNRNRTQKLPRC